jgi:hypothetical protein
MRWRVDITCFDDTDQKMMNHSETHILKSLILVSPLKRGCSFLASRFIQIVINLVPKWASDRSRGFLWDQRVKKSRVLKTLQKLLPEKYNTCYKYAPKKGSRKVIHVVWWFLRSPSQHGPQGLPGKPLGLKSIHKWRPRHRLSVVSWLVFHTLWRHSANVPCVPWTTPL